MQFEKQGVPTVLICSNAFEPIARTLAKSLGVPDLTISVTAHPFSWSGVTREQIDERAARIFEQVVTGLTRT